MTRRVRRHPQKTSQEARTCATPFDSNCRWGHWRPGRPRLVSCRDGREAPGLASASLGRRRDSYAHATRRGCRVPIRITELPDAPCRRSRDPGARVTSRAPAHRAPLHRAVDHGDRVETEFENGKRITVDALVGADGIHSTVRPLLFGPEKPHFTGCVAYRGLVPADRLAHLGLEVTAQVWMGPGKHFVHFYVQQRRLLNFVAIIEQDTWTRESWTDRGQVADALAAYEGWHSQVRSILGAVDETFIWALFDRKPMPRWSVGRVTLLGDAC